MAYDEQTIKEQLLALRLEKLNALERKVNLQTNLPHLHGWKLYKWAQEYWDSLEKISILCAANQISKSSTQIRKHIHMATAMDEWPKWWRKRPLQFWYLYPTRDVAHIEWKKKWEPEFMPRGEFKTDSKYGWKEEIFHSRIFAIHWNSGVSTYFKTYAQDVQDLQTGTVDKLDLDEEPPEEIMSELFMRLAASDGYFSAVFTPTLGQEYWRCAIEEKGKYERFPGAFKRQISMYDCLFYADGTPSPWTIEKILRAEAACKTQAEIDKRVYGKFVVAEGLKYPAFHKMTNVKAGHPVPKDWVYYCGVDIGSGGDDNHPSAICIVAVSPDYTQARVIDGWRGDGIVTTASDVVARTLEMTANLPNCQIHYDWASRDFYNIATGMGIVVEPAEKSHAIGEQVLNVLFKNQMLWVYDYAQLAPLVVELSTLKNSTPKSKAKDDFIDALRYAVAKIPFNWETIRFDYKAPGAAAKKSAKDLEIEARRGLTTNDDGLISAELELARYDELLGSSDEYEFYH